MRELLFKGEYNTIKDACELDEGDCKKCPLGEFVDVRIKEEGTSYLMTICELMESIGEDWL